MKMSEMIRSKKGEFSGLGNLPGIAVTFVVIGVIFAIGFSILQQNQTTFATCESGFAYSSSTDNCINATNSSSSTRNVLGTYAYNATKGTQNGMANITGYLPTIGLVTAAVIVVGLVIGLLYLKNR